MQRSSSQRTRVEPRRGHSLFIEEGESLRIELPDGPQVVDLIAFNRTEPRERFSSSTTRQQFGAHLTAGDALLSGPPWERPMLDITGDSLTGRVAEDGSGALPHDLLFGRCTHLVRQQLYGEDSPGCQENLAAAIEEHGLTEHDVVDPFNVFMTTGLGPDDQTFFVSSIARAGDHVELVARMPCLIAISTCPGASSGPVSHAVVLEVTA